MINKKTGGYQESISIPDKLYFKIGEISEITGIEPYVLRYWESEFNILKPSRAKSKQRLYKKKDLELVLEIKKLLYEEEFTIAGAKKQLREYSSREYNRPQTAPPKDGDNNLLKDIKNELKAIREILK